MLLGGTPMAWNAITDHNEAPNVNVVANPDYYTPAAPWHPKLPNSPMLGLSKANAAGTMKVHAHLRAPHFRLFHHNRIGGYWSRRMFRGAIRGLFGGW
jgi:hypothetical protein